MTHSPQQRDQKKLRKIGASVGRLTAIIHLDWNGAAGGTVCGITGLTFSGMPNLGRTDG